MEKTVTLKNSTDVQIRDLTADDVDRSLTFFRNLPPDERIYLRNDVTRREVVEERIRIMSSGRIQRLVAVHDDQIVADGSLESEGYSWKGHVAELRILVTPAFRHQSLGMLLARDLYLIAASKRVEELVVKLMRPQEASHRIVERLGFREEAVIRDYVQDTNGNKHDLVIMRCRLQKLMHEMEEYFMADDWQRTR